MHRYFAVVVCLVLILVVRVVDGQQPKAAETQPADVAPQNDSMEWHDFFVVVPRQPIPVGDDYKAHLLHRGDKVQVGKAASNGMLNIRFQADSKTIQALIPGTLLSLKKPKELPAQPTPAGPKPSAEPVDDATKLRGTWALVGWIVQGQPNDADSLLKARMMVLPVGDLFKFSKSELTTWSLMSKLNPDQSVKVERMAIPVPFEYQLHSDRKVPALDVTHGPAGRMTYPGIYKFDDDFLLWAFRPSIPAFVVTVRPDDVKQKIENARPSGFSPEELKQLVVLILQRVDEREFPAPPRPKVRPQPQGGNFF
jgi:hypothetical protein